jgi:hypothetical protein
VVINTIAWQGSHFSGNSGKSGKVRELRRDWKVREKSGNLEILTKKSGN